MKRLGVISVVFMAAYPGQGAQGQGPPVETGTRLRVSTVHVGAGGSSTTVQETRFKGQLERVSHDSVWIRVGANGPLMSIERGSIHRLEISDGRRRNPGKGALWGAGVGLGLGVLAAVTLDDCTVGSGRYWFDLCDGDEDVLILGSLAAGAAWGALIGSFIKSERWVEVPPASLTLRRNGQGVSLGVEVRLRL
jgi:hypothetical protein